MQHFPGVCVLYVDTSALQLYAILAVLMMIDFAITVTGQFNAPVRLYTIYVMPHATFLHSRGQAARVPVAWHTAMLPAVILVRRASRTHLVHGLPLQRVMARMVTVGDAVAAGGEGEALASSERRAACELVWTACSCPPSHVVSCALMSMTPLATLRSGAGSRSVECKGTVKESRASSGMVSAEQT